MNLFKKIIEINYTPTSTPHRNIDIPIYLSSNNITKKNTIHSFSSTTCKTKIGDTLPVSILLENTSNCLTPVITLEIINDENFVFIPGSLVNPLTTEAYCPNEINSSIFYLKPLEPFEKLEIIFFVKARLANLQKNPSSTSLIFLPCCTDKNNYTKEISTPFLIDISQAILEINSNSKTGTITIKNSGLDSAKQLYLKYITPKGFQSDISSVTAKLNNSPIEISSLKIDNDILFFINHIPSSVNNAPSVLNISFTSHDLNSLHSFSMNIVEN